MELSRTRDFSFRSGSIGPATRHSTIRFDKAAKRRPEIDAAWFNYFDTVGKVLRPPVAQSNSRASRTLARFDLAQPSGAVRGGNINLLVECAMKGIGTIVLFFAVLTAAPQAQADRIAT